MTKFNSMPPSPTRKGQKKPAPTPGAHARKPDKPRKDFPLYAHASGQWAKKVRQKLHYFGPWADPQAALERWLDEKDDLLAGRIPRSRTAAADAPNLRDLCKTFLLTKAARRDAGELSPHTWKAYHSVCDELGATFGGDRLLIDILPEDFEKLYGRWSKKWGVERLAAEINRVRTVFNYAYESRLIKQPMIYGPGFVRPSKKAMRLNKAAQGLRMFEAEELRRMIAKATQPMKAMLLLAVNGGMGNNDVAQMPITALDLTAGWANYPRPKTGIMRRVPLWPETIAAIQEWMAKRPAPKGEANEGLIFLTARGDGWASNINDRAITHECRKLLDALGIQGKRNFYALRHTFETIGGDARDQVAVDAIMGHDDGKMSSRYRERLSDERLKAVTDLVRGWLFAKPGKKSQKKPRLKIAEEEGDAAAIA